MWFNLPDSTLLDSRLFAVWYTSYAFESSSGLFELVWERFLSVGATELRAVGCVVYDPRRL